MMLDGDDQKLVAEVNQSSGPLMELGVTGLKRSAGYLDEEFLPQLKGRKAVQVFREMADNDPVVGALLFAIMQLLKNVEWNVNPAGKSKDHANAAKLVETAMEDMSHSWQDMIMEIMSCLPYGWSWHEIVYKRCMGPWEKDGRHRSKYSDGLIRWRKMPIRAQETLHRWVFDETGDVRAMVQLAPPSYKQTVLPIERSLLFRAGHHKGSPEGRSMLRNAYRPWYYKKRLEEFEAIGIERDLVGLPVVKVPASWLKAAPGTPQAKQVDAFKKMVRGLRRGEQEGVVFPNSFDEETRQPLFSLELLAGSSRQVQVRPTIEAYSTEILMTVLADFIKLGQAGTSGTYNMHVDKTGIFKASLNGIAQMIADVFNRHAIPRLFAVNGWKPAELPTIQPSDVDAPNLTELAAFLTQTANLGFVWGPDAELEKYLRQAANLPILGETDMGKRTRDARMQESTRYAEAQTAYLAARSALAQATAAEQMMAQGEPTAEMHQEAMGLQQQAAAPEQQAQQQAAQEEDRQITQQGTLIGQAQQLKDLSETDSSAAGSGSGSKPASRSAKASKPTRAKPRSTR